MKIEQISYAFGGRTYTGYLADGSNGRRVPGILVAHEGGGMTEHPQARARMLAEAGYVAFAMDTFGEAITGREHAMQTIMALMGNLPELRGRADAALGVLRAQPGVDPDKLAAIGFCFGGTTVLELARGGGDVKCVVGFHSGLTTIAPQDAANITATVLVCIGAADPIIPAVQRDAFVAEMEAGKVDWRMLLFGGVGHSFTNPEVDAMNAPGFNYDAVADRRAWAAMTDLFDECFA